MNLHGYAQQQIATELPQAQQLANDVALYAKTHHKNQLVEFIAYKLLEKTYRATLPSYLKACRVGSTANEDIVPNYNMLVDMIDLEIDVIINKMNSIVQAKIDKVREIVGDDGFQEYMKTHTPEEVNKLIAEGSQ